MKFVHDLKVWQEAVALGAEVVRAVRQNVRRETRAVSDRLMITAVAAADAIAEGYGKYTPEEQRQNYRAAKATLLRLETELAIARHADLIATSAHAELSARVHGVTRLLGGYLIYLDRQLEKTVAG